MFTQEERSILDGHEVTLANGTSVRLSDDGKRIFFRSYEKTGAADVILNINTVRDQKTISGGLIRSYEAIGSLKHNESYPFKRVIQGPNIRRAISSIPATNAFNESPRARRKMFERAQLIQSNPSVVIQIDMRPLRSLISMFDLYCHPQCSIARNTAVKGSDIDAGIVVTEETCVEKQMAFVKNLRMQGFHVYHPCEKELAGFIEVNTVSFHTRTDILSLNPMDIKRKIVEIGFKS